MLTPRSNDKEEKRQLKKIKFLGLNNTKFKQTWRKLLGDDPGLMSGLGQSGKYTPNKKDEKRSKWREIFKKWSKKKNR